MMALFEQTEHTKYFISDKGEFFSLCDPWGGGKIRKRKACLNKKRGYLYARTGSHNYLVHRLVASAFLDNPNNKEAVNHKNGCKTDNRVENLEWITTKENARHAIDNGLTTLMKKNEGNLKYTNSQCREVLGRVASGMSYVAAGSKFNMPYSTVAHLVRGSRRMI